MKGILGELKNSVPNGYFFGRHLEVLEVFLGLDIFKRFRPLVQGSWEGGS